MVKNHKPYRYTVVLRGEIIFISLRINLLYSTFTKESKFLNNKLEQNLEMKKNLINTRFTVIPHISFLVVK